MSLINEALHKVQNQRTQAPGLGSDNKNQSLNYAVRPNRIGLIIGLGVCIIILVGLVAGLTVVLISKDRSLSVGKPEALAESKTSVSEVVDLPSISEPATESAEPGTQLPTHKIIEKPAAEPNQEIIDWLTQSKVTGVRITQSSSKVILNNDAFMPGESVNMNLGLKVLEIEAERVILIDSNGVKYVKIF